MQRLARRFCESHLYACISCCRRTVCILGVIFGCKNIIIPEVDPGLILELIESEKIELALFVPAVILFLLQHPKSEETDFTSLKQVIYGASPIAEDTLVKAIERMQCDFWQVYGLTETCGMATTMTPEYHDPAKGKLRSCGQPYPAGVEIKIVGLITMNWEPVKWERFS
ncbi:MAG: hypothetical protein Ct9H300mP4_05450 [Gammaproteobacteria bacterium]|nr:MAG: hypothetical protein Ct9H300mP4_05450 [Gammaproteobacteria bacterium]